MKYLFLLLSLFVGSSLFAGGYTFNIKGIEKYDQQVNFYPDATAVFHSDDNGYATLILPNGAVNIMKILDSRTIENTNTKLVIESKVLDTVQNKIGLLTLYFYPDSCYILLQWDNKYLVFTVISYDYK